jgi:hypothetical protein
MQDLVLALYQYAAAASQRTTPHLQKLLSGIGGEHKVAIGTHKHEDQHKDTGQDHGVGTNGYGGWCEYGAQVDPTPYGRCEFANALG